MAGEVNKFDPCKIMHEFYKQDNPSEDVQFKFVEAMEYLIKTAIFSDDIIAFSFNLAMYYRDIKNFRLEKKYLDMSIKHGSNLAKKELGFIWYFGLTGEHDYEKAFNLFSDSHTRIGQYMIADMYYQGQYVAKDDKKCRDILVELFENEKYEAQDDRFITSTCFPEIAIRLADLNISEELDTEEDLENLFVARDILSVRQMHRPFWGNIKTMKHILETTAELVVAKNDFKDIYDLLTLDADKATVHFNYLKTIYKIEVFSSESEIIYSFENRWYHGAEDFLEKACIDGKRITTVYNLISGIRVDK